MKINKEHIKDSLKATVIFGGLSFLQYFLFDGIEGGVTFGMFWLFRGLVALNAIQSGQQRASNEANISSNERRITTLESNVNNLQSDVSDLQNEVGQIDERVQGIEQTLLDQVAEAERRRILSRQQKLTTATDINALKIEFEYENGEKEAQFFFAKQDKFTGTIGETTVGQDTAGVPVKANVFYAKNDLIQNDIGEVNITGSVKVQQPSLKSLPKSDLTSKMLFDIDRANAITVYFGFADKAGIVKYDVYEKDRPTVYAIQNGEVDLHSSSDPENFPTIRGVEIVNRLDPNKEYVLEMKHSGSANIKVFDLLEDHKIYIADIMVHRVADSTNSVNEVISNDLFLNNSYTDNGTKNSLTGRRNFVEFFDIEQTEADGETNTFPVKAGTGVLAVRRVEIDNGRGYKELNEFIDWRKRFDDDGNVSIELTFTPKQGAYIKVVYDTVSHSLQRKLELTQPVTITGEYDRYKNMYVQNEAAFIEIRASEERY